MQRCVQMTPNFLVSFCKDSSIIKKDSYRDELHFLRSLKNSSVVLKYYGMQYLLFMNMGQIRDWAVVFFAMISYRARRYFCNSFFSPPTM